MRRLLASVAALAAVLLAPSAALAASAPVLNGPGPLTNSVDLTWNNVAVLDETITYQVYRASPDCAAPFSPVGAPLVDLLVYHDTAPDGSYCYYVTADDDVLESLPSNAIPTTLDATPPVITVTPAGGDGCTALFTFTATAADAHPGAMTVDAAPYTPGAPYTPIGDRYATVVASVGASDAAGNPSAAVPVSGRILDDIGPGPVTLEITTDPAQQKATLNWALLAPDGAPVQYNVRTKGPQGPSTAFGLTPPVVQQGLQVDATYEFTLDATDACTRTTSSVRLVRLNDSTPPTTPIVAGPSFDHAARTVRLSWVASSDNIQVDHYVILRDGVPLGATDATTFVDLAPPQHANLSYVVRAVDTNGNSTDSAAAPIPTPDWTPPTAPVLGKPVVKGSTVTLQWPPAADNVGVVGYEVFRDDVSKGTMTAARRSFPDTNVPRGVHTWRVRARDDANLTATSAPVTATVRKVTSKASVLSMRMVGGGRGASRYSLRARGRLLLDLRIVGTVRKPKLRIYVSSGRGRVTAWRGTPGSSAPRLRLGSALVRHGYVTIRLNRTFHAGRSRLVLIASGRVVIVAKGAHKPSMKAG